MRELPEGWERVPLMSVVELHDNRRIPLNAKQRAEKQGPFPYYGANGQVDSIDEYIFDGDYILLAEDGGYFDDPSRNVAYEASGRFWVNNHAHIISPKNGIPRRYLTYVLNSINWMPYVGGSTRLKLTQEGMRKIQIPLPPLAEQRRIVARLDALLGHVRRARAELAHIPGLVERQKQAVVNEAFFPSHSPKEVHFSKLLHVINGIKTGPFGSSLHKSDYIEGGVPVINPMHINARKIIPTSDMTISEVKAEELRDFRMKAGEIVIARRGVMGRCAVVHKAQEGWLCGTGSMILSPKSDMSPDYLQLFLSSPTVVQTLEGAAVGSTMVNLNQSILLNLDIRLASPEEQHEIVAQIEAAFVRIERSAAEAARAMALLERMEQATLAQAFRGEV